MLETYGWNRKVDWMGVTLLKRRDGKLVSGGVNRNIQQR